MQKSAPRGALFRRWPWVGGSGQRDDVTDQPRLENQLLVEIHKRGLRDLTTSKRFKTRVADFGQLAARRSLS